MKIALKLFLSILIGVISIIAILFICGPDKARNYLLLYPVIFVASILFDFFDKKIKEKTNNQ
jgi:hypothetical protein